MASWGVGLGRQCLVGGVSFELWERLRNLYRRPQLWQSLLSGPLGQSNQATSKPSAELSPFCVRHPPLPSSRSQTCSPTTVQHSRWITHLASKCTCGKHSKKCNSVKITKSTFQTRVAVCSSEHDLPCLSLEYTADEILNRMKIEWGCLSYSTYNMYTHKLSLWKCESMQTNVCANTHRQSCKNRALLCPKSTVSFITHVTSQAHAVMGPPEARCVPSKEP